MPGSPLLVTGYPPSDSTMVLYVGPKNASANPNPMAGKTTTPMPGSAGAESYTWTFGNSPKRSLGK
jgi:hypothetical protein